MPDYSFWIVEYARVNEFAQRRPLRDGTPGTLILPYCYGVLQSDDHLAVVDTGFDFAEYGQAMAEIYGVTDWQPPEVVLEPDRHRPRRGRHGDPHAQPLRPRRRRRFLPERARVPAVP